MHVMILGAGGMLGHKLATAIATKAEVAGQKVDRLTLVDLFEPPKPMIGGPCVMATQAADISQAQDAEHVLAKRPDIVFHLAAVVSGEAEANFDKGYSVNLDGTRQVFEAIRKQQDYQPRVVFTSSIAVYGAPFPDVIPDDFALTPLTSYGTQKVIGEQLLADYSRRGYVDGIGIRLPTICVRPGKPNKAASGFFSNIIREPLVGKEAVLPVVDSVRHWFASPRAAVGFLLHAASIKRTELGVRVNLQMPGVSATVGEQIEALTEVAGKQAVALIRREENADIARIVAGWPQSFSASRARELGFVAEASFKEIIQAHIEDELS